MADIIPLQYMGSKGRMLDSVRDAIELPHPKRVFDLFAGTGIVGSSLQCRHEIISNDIEYYAYVLNDSLLNGCYMDKEKQREFLHEANECYRKRCDRFADCLAEEEQFLIGSSCNWKAYRDYCDQTPYIGDPSIGTSDMEAIREAIRQIGSGEDGDYNLFISYFSNAYFGINQCCEIDACCEAISSVDDLRTKHVLLAALMSALSECASTTTHFAQYLKVRSPRTFEHIVSNRSESILRLMAQHLEDLREGGLLTRRTSIARCLNMDYLDALDSVAMDSTMTVYADPPYFKEHYSRYYHVLNTLCLYDYPSITVNPQTKKPSVGRYRDGRISSPFGRRKSAYPAFEKLIERCSESHASLVISYSTNSIVSIDDIFAALESHYDNTEVRSIPLRHSGQGRAGVTNGGMATEYLLIGGRAE